jgi:hypothetical protein
MSSSDRPPSPRRAHACPLGFGAPCPCPTAHRAACYAHCAPTETRTRADRFADRVLVVVALVFVLACAVHTCAVHTCAAEPRAPVDVDASLSAGP